MSFREDTYLNRMPYTITHALKGDLDLNDRWKQLLMAVEDSHDDGPPLDPDFRDHLELCHRRKESPTERLLSELGHKGYRVCHLRKWLRAQGLMRACELLEGGDRTTGRLPVQRSQSTNSKSWMYEPEPEFRRNQSAEERGGGNTIQLPSDHLTTYGSHAGKGGGTVELEGDILTCLVSTERPGAGDSMSEGAGVVESPSKSDRSSEVERESEPRGTSAMAKPSESGSANAVERPNRSEVTSAVEGRSEPEGAGTAEILNKSDSDSVVEEPKELKDAIDRQNSESISRVNLTYSKHATIRRRTEEAQPEKPSPSPSENHALVEAEGGPYLQHHLVGSETVRHRETTVSGGGGGSSPKKEDTETPQPLPLAPPPSSPSGVGKCTIVYIVLAAVILWVAALGIALYTLK